MKQLIAKLQKQPEDSKVIFENTDTFFNGAYEVTAVYDYKDGTVVLDSNHKKNYWEDD